MRIVSGVLKGRLFHPPSNFKARPTTDIAKESLFNILNSFIDYESTTVLDLFSGTGSISYEFASRGCPSVISVEKNFHHFKFIKKCVEDFKLDNIIKPLNTDVFIYLTKVREQTFDLIYADPPFDLNSLDKIPDIVMESNILKNDGLFILEHGANNNFENHKNFSQMRKYGKVCFTFFK